MTVRRVFAGAVNPGAKIPRGDLPWLVAGVFAGGVLLSVAGNGTWDIAPVRSG